MRESNILNLEEVTFSSVPYSHFSIRNIFRDDYADRILNWLYSAIDWQYTETDFYSQYEFSLMDMLVPEHLSFIYSDSTIEYIKGRYNDIFGSENLKLVDITIHKLIDGHKMGVHNDFIGKQESHRLVVQLNKDWSDENGGYLMLFNSASSSDIASLIRPVHNTAVGFAISSKSFHAVSRVNDFERYTLVYTFKEVDGDN